MRAALTRREVLQRGLFVLLASSLAAAGCPATVDGNQLMAGAAPSPSPDAPEYTPLPALQGKDYGKTRIRASDFILLPSGVQYKDIRVGDESITPEPGDRVVIDWSGYTIGYYGRIFEAKNRVRGGAFADDAAYSRFVLGQGQLIPALEETLRTMHPGGVRQIIVPPEQGYPLDGSDAGHDRVGPKPRTFSGMRSLNFVLENRGFIDKTLLFNVEMVRVDKKGEHGFEVLPRRRLNG